MTGVRFRVLCLSVVVAVVIGGFAGMAGGAATGDTAASPTAQTATDGNDTTTVQRGDTAAFPVQTDDGRVAFVVNTYAAGVGPVADGLSAADRADEVTVDDATGLPESPLPVGQYDLTRPDRSDGTTLQTIRVINRTGGVDVRLFTAPESLHSTLDSYDDVTDAIDAGRVTPTEAVAMGDLLVVEADVSNLTGAVQAHRGPTGFETFRNLLDNGTLSLSMEQTPETVTIQRPPKELSLNASADAVTVVYGPDSERLFLVADTAGLRFEEFEDHDPVPADLGDAFDVELAVTDPDVDTRNESATARFEVAEREVALPDPDDTHLLTRPDQRLIGKTTLAPTTELGLTVDAPNRSETRTVTIGPNGTFEATLDLGGLQAGDRVRVSVDSPRFDESYDYTVHTRLPDPRATVQFSDQETADGRFFSIASTRRAAGSPCCTGGVRTAR